MASRIGGIFLLAVAVVVAVHTVVEPLYHVSAEGQPYSPVWEVLDPIMVLAVALGAVVTWRRKRSVDEQGDDGPVTREFLAANALFFGFLFVGILLTWAGWRGRQMWLVVWCGGLIVASIAYIGWILFEGG